MEYIQSMKKYIFGLATVCCIFSCNEVQKPQQNDAAPKKVDATKLKPAPDTIASASTILQRQQVPILCYHRIENNKPPTNYSLSVTLFREQLKMLADSGYHTILPDQLYDYLTKGIALPSNPFMLTFDDTRKEHASIAAPEMEKYGFKGVFFVMTIPIGKPNYMTSEEIKELSDKGHVVASHTWDHHNVKQFKENDWTVQIEKPNQRLQAITGKPVRYFAYPFGEWNDSAAIQIKKHSFKAAFQLTAKRSETEPLFTIRRTLVPGTWSAPQLLKRMKTMF